MGNFRADQRVAIMSDIINQEITRIYLRDGKVIASTVLAEAESSDSPLHGYFEWDDAKASHKYRLVQARTMIRVAKIIMPDGTHEHPVHVPKVGVNGQRESYYKPATVIARNIDEFAIALEQAEKVARSARNSLEALLSAANAQKGTQKSQKVHLVVLAMKGMDAAIGAIHNLH